MSKKRYILVMILLLCAVSALQAQTIVGKIYGGGEIALVDGDTKVEVYTGIVGNNSSYNGGVFGGGLGSTTVVTGSVEVIVGKEGAIRDAAAATIYGDVYGGSALGNVNCSVAEPHTATADKSTTVTLNAGVVHGSIFGGALGQKNGVGGATSDIEANVYGPVHVNVYGGNVFATDGTGANGSGGVFGCNNLNGEPKDSVHVDVYGTNSHDDNGPDDYDDDSYAVFSVYGGGNQADYSSGTPHVTVHNCDNSIKYVYGGGNAAHLTHPTNGHTDVVIWGGNRIGDVFGGGNGQVQAANISGNTNVTIHGGLIGNVFGGSNTNGTIGGVPNVSVLLQVEGEGAACSMDIANVYGGGNRAPGKAGTITIACTGTGRIDNVYGGANQANLTGDITLNINGGNIGNVFGGNNSSGAIDGSITVNVDWNTSACGSNSLNNVYGGGNRAPYDKGTHADPVVNIRNAEISGDVFGGGLGEAAIVTGDPHVNVITDGTNRTVTIGGSVYGGGSAAKVIGSPVVTTRGFDTDDHKVYIATHVFGGGLGSTAIVTGSTRVNIYGNTEIEQNVYGGGNGGVVQGDTNVTIGENCASH